MFDLDQLFQKIRADPSDHPACPDQGRADAGLYESGGSGADAPDKDCLVLEPEPGQTMEQGETSGHFLHVEQIFTDCDTDTPALLLPARRPYLSHRTRQLLFSGDYVMIPIVPLGS